MVRVREATSLILAGFNPHVTAAAANVAALCDHGGGHLPCQPGWPNLTSIGPHFEKLKMRG